jgi:hypothetical protein
MCLRIVGIVRDGDSVMLDLRLIRENPDIGAIKAEAVRITVEDGHVTAPIRGATLIGNGPDALTTVSMVGNDLKLDEGVGTCGKDGQAVPVGVGMPTTKLDRLTVGGTARKDPGGFMQ